ncbi:hypothetical protein EXIGLDRAFT_703011 [Exidia glandulosa HHB12029]|uniref:Uncharacterized protein n=1 Tax=Exidia glandulosa HHB12029 TaxID=1314781 RepID=A0A165L9U3_EXIGL|nr:hypothetical protein EXIGLDRAFT_703011 [Exidia glandulosa HHB12029]
MANDLVSLHVPDVLWTCQPANITWTSDILWPVTNLSIWISKILPAPKTDVGILTTPAESLILEEWLEIIGNGTAVTWLVDVAGGYPYRFDLYGGLYGGNGLLTSVSTNISAGGSCAELQVESVPLALWDLQPLYQFQQQRRRTQRRATTHAYPIPATASPSPSDAKRELARVFMGKDGGRPATFSEETREGAEIEQLRAAVAQLEEEARKIHGIWVCTYGLRNHFSVEICAGDAFPGIRQVGLQSVPMENGDTGQAGLGSIPVSEFHTEYVALNHYLCHSRISLYP